MKQRAIRKIVQGRATVDGAGVKLVRVLGRDDVRDFDPFLMLDSFDSHTPSDYLAGFPSHPHRGIETITYLVTGRIEHKDSLGNTGLIQSGQSQWMTAGSGIIHQEMPLESPHMLGLQLWLNLPQAEKMTDSKYLEITQDMMGVAHVPGGLVRVLSGECMGAKGVKPPHIQASMYDITLEAGASLRLDTVPAETVFVFLLTGDALLGGQPVRAKSAVLFAEGDCIAMSAPPHTPARLMFFSGKPLNESIAWGGPLVMNTQQELDEAFKELREGTFVRHEAKLHPV